MFIFFQSVAYALRNKKPFLRDIADRVMRAIGQQLVITKTVNELLFEGYDDVMLKIARKLNLTKIPMDKFGWFYEVSSISVVLLKRKCQKQKFLLINPFNSILISSEKWFCIIRWNI